MDRFICVRLVKANAMDLGLLQFDYDLTFAALMMHADGTLYGRFGTRTSRHDAEKDISLEGFAAALEASLALHAEYPANRKQLAGKQPRPTEYAVPEDYPSLQGKYQPQLDYQGQVVRSCLHCHQIRDAQRRAYREASQALPDQALFPYPPPQVIGLTLDPRTRATVAAVEPDSPAARAGLAPGDQIVTLQGQPIGSIADVQWVLHQAGDTAEVRAVVHRQENSRPLTISLPAGWRRATDISWRVSTWDLRRMALGGMVLERMPVDGSARAGSTQSLALRVRHVGQYGEHAVAKRAGFQTGDVLVSFHGQSGDMTESELLAYALQQTRPGQEVPVSVLRDGKRIDLTLPMQ
jgi:hypothetical protein